MELTPPVGQGAFHNAGVLYLVATNAYDGTKSAPSDRDYCGVDALVAIVFSAIALEAFINETAESALLFPPPGDREESATVEAFATLLEEVERSRGSVTLKFLLASAVLTGRAYDKGRQPYQDFSLLMEVRNALVHMKLEKTYHGPEGEMLVDVRPIIKRLHAKKLLAKRPKGTVSSWVTQITTRAAARWACNTCSAMVQSVVDMAPQGSWFRYRVDALYAKLFQPVT